MPLSVKLILPKFNYKLPINEDLRQVFKIDNAYIS